MKKLKISTVIIAVAGLAASIFAYRGIRKGIAAWRGIEVPDEEPEEPVGDARPEVADACDCECACASNARH